MVVSRSFTIYQLANTIINELPKKLIIQQFCNAKVIVIGDLLSMFTNDLQVRIKEKESLLIQIINAIIKMSLYNNLLFVISLCLNNTTRTSKTITYSRLILQRIAKCIEISNRQIDNNDRLLPIDITINKDGKRRQQHQLLLKEKMLI
jgi:hypothetical protein